MTLADKIAALAKTYSRESRDTMYLAGVQAGIELAAALAEQEQAADQTPVDEVFAASVLHDENCAMRCERRFKSRNNELQLIAIACAGPRCWEWALYCYGQLVKRNPSRADVLRLAAALGITLSLEAGR